jgi:heme-degrading monooxygenase HmoA
MSKPVFEVIVYTVNERILKEFESNLETAHGLLRSFPGFRNLRTLRKPGTPATFVDYCEWDSLEQAQEAGKKAMEMPEMKLYFELGEDSLITFGHYETVRFTERL